MDELLNIEKLTGHEKFLVGKQLTTVTVLSRNLFVNMCVYIGIHIEIRACEFVCHFHSFIHSFVWYSALRQVHSLFQS